MDATISPPSVYDHPEYAAFLRAILTEPADDTARLVAADWLEEHGERERAEFIRVQIAASRGAEPPSLKIWDLLHGSENWFPSLYAATRVNWHHWGIMHDETVHYEHKLSPSEAFVRRGFADEIRCPAADWLAHADALTSAHPIERVTITDASGWDARIAQFDSHAPDGTFGCSRWPRIRFQLPSNVMADVV